MKKISKPQVFTIGVYGKTEDEFFKLLVDNQIDVFVDIRQRRGVRGALYMFANKLRLVAKLEELRILYLYAKQYAPDKELREIQKRQDKDDKVLKRERAQMSNDFVNEYIKNVIEQNPIVDLIEEIKELSGNQFPRFCLCCVEAEPEACHRSIVAGEIAREMNTDVCNL
ncbi:DUF488 domain-containing protein [bacterium]|nr:DUF488 domain-containing protein [bacterium]